MLPEQLVTVVADEICQCCLAQNSLRNGLLLCTVLFHYRNILCGAAAEAHSSRMCRKLLALKFLRENMKPETLILSDVSAQFCLLHMAEAVGVNHKAPP